MAEYRDREHFIPLRRTELVNLLCADEGLTARERASLRQLCDLVSATYHFEYHKRLEELKDAYAPFDPDADTRSLATCTTTERQNKLDALFTEFTWLMERANFKHLTRDDVRAALTGASDWGINMDVDFAVFERLEIFARGDGLGKRTRRRWYRLWRLEQVEVPIYQRLVLILKLTKHKRLGPHPDTQRVYLKAFKDIPKLDLEMLLPGARVQITKWDRGMIGFPLLSGLGVIAWNILQDLGRFLNLIGGAILNPAYLWAFAVGGVGYGYKSWHGYTTTKQRYSLNLTQSLYYQNLDNNGGVIFHLLDEAEEQECREAILAYYFLWRRAGHDGWTSAALDDYVEVYLEKHANLKVDFEIGDAIDKLEKLHIVARVGDRYRAHPLAKALEMLDWTWDNYFKFNNPEEEQPPLP
jgi:hypothetical protein